MGSEMCIRDRNKLVNVPAGYKTFLGCEGEERPSRTAIYIPFGASAIQLGHLSNRDCTTILLKTPTGKMVISSIYLDILTQIRQSWLTRLLNYAENEDLPMIIGMDSNAHSQLYGPTTNKRGEELEEIILQHGLFVENRGEIPTYEAWRMGRMIQTCIDVTLTRGNVEIRGWGVDQGYNASDHNTIRWDTPDSHPPVEYIRPWRQAKWKLFTENLVNTTIEVPDSFSAKDVDDMLEATEAALNASLDLACPKKEAKASWKKNHWYTEDLREFSKKVRRQYSTAKRIKSAYEMSKYKKLQRKYRIKCRRAKRKSWRLFIETTPCLLYTSDAADE